jgi:hypothetical protein
MWQPVPVLFDVLSFVRMRVAPKKLAGYLVVLANETKHLDHLAEMFPVLRVGGSLQIDHEVAGLGAGNRTVDWVIGPIAGRRVVLDVKRRLADFLAQMGTASADNAGPPMHNVELLFSSVEGKFLAADADAQLQGVWIGTDIKQEQGEFTTALNALDPSKVHFAILGDHRADGYILTRRPEDRQFLRDLLQMSESDRFVFTREEKPQDT